MGFVVFELTADPILGLVVACLKFGASDAVTAAWVVRHDPIKTRGRACLWFLIARALAKIALAALAAGFGCIFGVAILFGILHWNNMQNLDAIVKHSTAGIPPGRIESSAIEFTASSPRAALAIYWFISIVVFIAMTPFRDVRDKVAIGAENEEFHHGKHGRTRTGS